MDCEHGQEAGMTKEWELVITRRASKSAKMKVMAKTYPDAIEAAMKLARTGQVKWSDENAIVQHEFNNCDPEAFPALP